MSLETLIKLEQDGDIVIIKRLIPWYLRLFYWASYVDWKSPNSEINELDIKMNALATEFYECLQERERREEALKTIKSDIKKNSAGQARRAFGPISHVIKDKKDFRFRPLNYVPTPELFWKEIIKPELTDGKDCLGIAAKWRAMKGGTGPAGTVTRFVPNVEDFKQKLSTNHNAYGDDGVDDVIQYRFPDDKNKGGSKKKMSGPWKKRRPGESDRSYSKRMQRINSGNPQPGDMDVMDDDDLD